MTVNTALQTDLYQLTMGYGYWKQGMAERNAVFHLYYRRAPFGESCVVAAGLENALNWIKDFKFNDKELEYLGSLLGNDGKPLFDRDYIDYLREMKLSVNVWAIPEGELAYPNEPLMRVEGPLIQCQLLETALLNIINFQTLVATQAARICEAANGDEVLEFGLRRAQGPDGGLSASRAAYIGGVAATSNVEAGYQYGIPVKGTHAHSWVMSFESELEAFEIYADAMPNNSVLLVDTYDTLEGVKKAIQVAKELKENGHDLAGVRLDSGDLCELSIGARDLLDEAGLSDVKIVASNDLDAETITNLKLNGAKIDVWGVGTKLVTAYEQPALGGVYKLAAIEGEAGEWQWKMKQSNEPVKRSLPGILQVERRAMGDRIFHDPSAEKGGLLKRYVRGGEIKEDGRSLVSVRELASERWRGRDSSVAVLIDIELLELQAKCLR